MTRKPTGWAIVPEQGRNRAVERGCRALALAAALALGCLSTPASAAKPGQVPAAEATGWRLGAHEAAQRIVVDLTRSIEFKVFQLADPPRVVVDMPEIDWHRLDHVGPL